jgi:hypothetical protein
MTEHNPVSVELTDPVELVEQPNRVQLVAAVGIVAGLVIGLLGVIALAALEVATPGELWPVLGALAGGLTTLLLPRR